MNETLRKQTRLGAIDYLGRKRCSGSFCHPKWQFFVLPVHLTHRSANFSDWQPTSVLGSASYCSLRQLKPKATNKFSRKLLHNSQKSKMAVSPVSLITKPQNKLWLVHSFPVFFMVKTYLLCTISLGNSVTVKKP